MIESPANPTVKALRLLSTSKGRREQDRFLVEGIRLIEDGLASGELPITCLYNYDLAGRTERGRMLLKRLSAANVTVLEATERVIEAASDTPHPQGIVAAFRLRSQTTPPKSDGSALGVVCDAVQDPGNLGTLLRSAEAAGAVGVWLTPGCVDAYSPKVVRAAMGAHFRLPIFSSTWPEIARELENLGILPSNLYVTEAEADIPYDAVDWTAPSTLVISNEAHGLSQDGRETVMSAQFITIPMSGHTESLNAAVAGSVILFEAAPAQGTSNEDMRDPTPANKGPLVWVLASGPVDDPARATEGLVPADIVIAADGGSSLAARLSLVPNLIVGDLDSSEPAVVADFEAQGVEIRRYDHHTKSETDTELALFAALEWEPSEILLLGALGGRVDHSLANILLLTNPRLDGTKVRIVDGPEEIYLAQPQVWTEVHGKIGDRVSLLPIGETATGVTLQGLEYPLDNEPLVQGFARGVSNRLTRHTGRIWVESGLLLVVLTRGTFSEP